MFNLLSIKFSIVAVLVLALGIVFHPPTASAQTTSRQGGTINPASIQQQMEPGNKKSFSITVKNAGSENVKVSYTLNDATISTGPEQQTIYTAQTNNLLQILPSWITLEQVSKSILAPEATLTIRGSIQVPPSATSGEYPGLLTFRLNPTSTENRSGSGVATELAAKIMITVGNPTAEGNATLTANPTTSFAGDPVTFTVSFKNTGNTSTVPKGRILILDEQQTPTLVLPINPTGKAITSHNSTSFNVTTSEIYSIGKEQVRLELWYGNGSQKQYTSQTMSLYRLPKRNIVYIGGGIVLGVPLLGAWHRKRKRNKKISSV
jgi:hypothetical protein